MRWGGGLSCFLSAETRNDKIFILLSKKEQVKRNNSFSIGLHIFLHLVFQNAFFYRKLFISYGPSARSFSANQMNADHLKEEGTYSLSGSNGSKSEALTE